jgi:hypothetical protein
MHFLYSLGGRRAVLTLSLLGTAALAHAQSDARETTFAPAPPRVNHDRIYLMGGLSLADFDGLNSTLRATPYPTLGANAAMIGFGFATDRAARFNIGSEMRLLLRNRHIRSTDAQSSYSGFVVAVPVRLTLARTPRLQVSAVAGPQLMVQMLTLHNPDSATVSSFTGYLATGQSLAQPRRTYQTTVGAMGGLQADWILPRTWAGKDGSTTQLGIGLRIQYALPVFYSRWRVQRNDVFRNTPDPKLTGGPRFNSEGFTAALVVSGLFTSLEKPKHNAAFSDE